MRGFGFSYIFWKPLINRSESQLLDGMPSYSTGLIIITPLKRYDSSHEDTGIHTKRRNYHTRHLTLPKRRVEIQSRTARDILNLHTSTHPHVVRQSHVRRRSSTKRTGCEIWAFLGYFAVGTRNRGNAYFSTISRRPRMSRANGMGKIRCL